MLWRWVDWCEAIIKWKLWYETFIVNRTLSCGHAEWRACERLGRLSPNEWTVSYHWLWVLPREIQIDSSTQMRSGLRSVGRSVVDSEAPLELQEKNFASLLCYTLLLDGGWTMWTRWTLYIPAPVLVLLLHTYVITPLQSFRWRNKHANLPLKQVVGGHISPLNGHVRVRCTWRALQDKTGSAAAISNYLINVGSFLRHLEVIQSVKRNGWPLKGETLIPYSVSSEGHLFGRFYLSYRCLRAGPLYTTSPSMGRYIARIPQRYTGELSSQSTTI